MDPIKKISRVNLRNVRFEHSDWLEMFHPPIRIWLTKILVQLNEREGEVGYGQSRHMEC